jgi:aspartate 1-decarboxylase
MHVGSVYLHIYLKCWIHTGHVTRVTDIDLHYLGTYTIDSMLLSKETRTQSSPVHLNDTQPY